MVPAASVDAQRHRRGAATAPQRHQAASDASYRGAATARLDLGRRREHLRAPELILERAVHAFVLRVGCVDESGRRRGRFGELGSLRHRGEASADAQKRSRGGAAASLRAVAGEM